ncbi:MAG: hypothetical protein EAZ27_05420 [Cytophagales bacterium]|nr:MAG: hypothetical protein EAZ27_05420 [Cytophagales bacterium]
MILDKIESYFKEKFTSFQIETSEQINKIIQIIISKLILVFTVFMFIILLTISLAIIINNYFKNNWIGFMLFSFLYALVSIILYFYKKRTN